MEFKGTKGEWYHSKGTLSIWHPKKIGQRIICVDSDYLKATKEQLHNALLISKAPILLDEHYKDLEFLEKIAKQLDQLGGYLEQDVLDRIEFKKQLIKQATEL